MKEKTKEIKKKKLNKGITLIALVITIIVLLILATVSINLVINGGIIDKAKYAVDKYSEAEIGEQIKLAYLECETEKLYNSNINDENFIRDSLREKINDDNLTVKVKNGKVTVNITVKGEPKTYKYNSSTGKVFLDVINYGSKTEETVEPGDDISIGTENFKVFYNQNGIIKAMPYYNLVTVTADGTVKQGPAVEGISTKISSVFSKPFTRYWEFEEDEIDMNNPNNYIQQFISAYQTTLRKLGAYGITVRIAKHSELSVEGITNSMRNPGQSGDYWLGSGGNSYDPAVWKVKNTGELYDYYFYYTDDVRPIIIIEY